jgi:hypothetical protein
MSITTFHKYVWTSLRHYLHYHHIIILSYHHHHHAFREMDWCWPVRSQSRRSLYSGLPWFLMHLGSYIFNKFGNLDFGIRFTCRNFLANAVKSTLREYFFLFIYLSLFFFQMFFISFISYSLFLIHHIRLRQFSYHHEKLNNKLPACLYPQSLSWLPSRVTVGRFCPQLTNSNKIYQVAKKLLFVTPVPLPYWFKKIKSHFFSIRNYSYIKIIPTMCLHAYKTECYSFH